MRLRVVIPTLALTAILFVLPYTALAETVRIPFFGPIVPDAINRCPASFAMFIDVINRIILFSLTIGIVFVAPIMIAYAGFLMVVNPFNSAGIQKAKDIMLHTVVGIVIALAGWLIVAALMAVLYSPTNGLKAWNTIISSGGLDACLKQEGALLQLNQGQVTGSTATGELTVVPPSTAPASEAAIRQQFAAAGVGVNKPACNPYNLNGVVNGCTNVGNMRPNTVAQVIGIKTSCKGCVVTVTGGSEAGHASGDLSHGAGYKVDLRLEPTLNTYLQSMESIGKRTGDSLGDAYTDKCRNNQYVKESSHWDITVKSSCVPPK